jgi:serine/threonine protein kinase
MQISEKAPSFKEANPSEKFNREQERIIMKSLEKDPAKRYQTAEELGMELLQIPLKGSGTVRSFGGDLRKSGAQEPGSETMREPAMSTEVVAQKSSALASSVGGELADALKTAGRAKRQVTFRFRRFRTNMEKDLILQAMDLSLKLIKKSGDLSIYFDHEAVHLVHQSQLMAPEFHPDLATTEKIQMIQASIQKIIKAGGNVSAPEHWLRYFGILAGGQYKLLSGINVLDEDGLAEYLLERAVSIVDCT